MCRRLALLLLCLFLARPAWAAALTRSPLLDAGLSLLEEGNALIDRYNLLTGAQIQARYPLGLPYFFGGRYESRFLKVFEAWQDSGFFRTGRKYLGGLDCYGLAEWLARAAGQEAPPPLGEWTGKAQRFSDHLLPLDGVPYELLHLQLDIGDYLVLRHGYNHVMIFIGTLRDYGYAGSDLPRALSPYLDHPLFLQSGVNHYQGAWYSQYIADRGYRDVYTTDGGVCLALWGVPIESAPFSAQPQQALCRFFRLDGTALMVPDMREYTLVRYYRHW